MVSAASSRRRKGRVRLCDCGNVVPWEKPRYAGAVCCARCEDIDRRMRFNALVVAREQPHLYKCHLK